MSQTNTQDTRIDDTDKLLYKLFVNDVPLIDVRAAVEYEQGSFPSAVNLPLLDNEQRHLVGSLYKQKGKEAAIALGHELVSGEDKQQKLLAWKQFIQQHPNAHLYCFRGGLRSRTTCEWLRQQGVHIPLIPGGYKAMRRYLLQQLEKMVDFFQFYILGGKTGTAKTALLKQLKMSIDLEGLANHRGSSFGHRVTAQPTQIDFENRLAIEFLKKHHQSKRTLALEDEGFLIGKLLIPKSLHQKMQTMPLILLQADIDERVEVTLRDYIISNYQDYLAADPQLGQAYFRQYLQDSLFRIKKRLGGLKYQQLAAMMDDALRAQFEYQDLDGHRRWIKILMQDYYDPMYEYQLSKKTERIVFKGNYDAVKDYLLQVHQSSSPDSNHQEAIA